MKLIPVLDLLNKQVVQGIGGQRDIYQPIVDSIIVSNAEPLHVLNAFYDSLSLADFYIADLNQIQWKQESDEKAFQNLEIIKKLSENKEFNILLDGGCQTLADVNQQLALGIDFVVLGTETMKSMQFLEEVTSEINPEKIILSIDLKGGKLLTSSQQLQQTTPIKLAKYAESLGIQAIIVLDLEKVGSQKGPLTDSLLEISQGVSNIPVYTGGGVRSIEDIEILQENNISGALIATAFHKGKISRKELDKFFHK
ncbi:MAG: HisA/HisF-related TIM barrel protein [Candidatus Heimdallarchaeota archaeon]